MNESNIPLETQLPLNIEFGDKQFTAVKYYDKLNKK